MKNDHLYVGLADNFDLFSNGDSNILYKISLSDSKYFNLNGLAGVTTSLLDGSRTFAETANLVQELFSFPERAAAEKFLEELVTHFNVNEDVVLFAPKPFGTENRFNPKDFVLPDSLYKQSRRFRKPIRLLIYPTGKCQTNCVYCYADLENLRKRKDMDLQQWEKIFKEAQSLGIVCIDISGGDLFARDDAADFVCKMIEYGFLFYLSTKCFISAGDALKIAQAGFTKPLRGVQRDIQLSIDTTDETIAKELVRAERYVERMMNTAKNLIAAGILPKVKAVVSSRNADGLLDLINQFSALGVKEFNLVKYDDSFYRHDEALNITKEKELEIREAMGNLAFGRKNLLLTGNLTKNLVFDAQGNMLDEDKLVMPAADKITEITGCSAGRTTLGITPDGQATLCEQMHMVEPFVFGDFKTQSILEIWNHTALTDICFPDKEKFKSSVCYSCPEFDSCVYVKGQCFRDNYFGRNPDEEKGNLFRQPNSCMLLKEK